jgi:hypothetical protein
MVSIGITTMPPPRPDKEPIIPAQIDPSKTKTVNNKTVIIKYELR